MKKGQAVNAHKVPLQDITLTVPNVPEETSVATLQSALQLGLQCDVNELDFLGGWLAKANQKTHANFRSMHSWSYKSSDCESNGKAWVFITEKGDWEGVKQQCRSQWLFYWRRITASVFSASSRKKKKYSAKGGNVAKETFEENAFRGTNILENVKNFCGYQLPKILAAYTLEGTFNPVKKCFWWHLHKHHHVR